MALPQTQPLRAVVSTSGTVATTETATPRASLAFALSTGISPSERVDAAFIMAGRHDHWDHHDHGRDHGRWPDHRWPGPIFPIPIPIPSPYPPGPFDRRCSPWEEGRPGSYQDVYGRWWCRW